MAPIQAVIVPIAQHKEGVLDKVFELKSELSKKIRIKVDDRDKYSPGYKFNYWEMKGVPVRIEMGPRDIENGECILVRRDNGEKITVKISELENKLEELLKDIHNPLFLKDK